MRISLLQTLNLTNSTENYIKIHFLIFLCTPPKSDVICTSAIPNICEVEKIKYLNTPSQDVLTRNINIS